MLLVDLESFEMNLFNNRAEIMLSKNKELQEINYTRNVKKKANLGSTGKVEERKIIFYFA